MSKLPRALAWLWTSLNQQIPPPSGDGVIGRTYSTAAEEGTIWTLAIDPGSEINPFSLRLANAFNDGEPMYFEPVFQKYGNGSLELDGIGMAQPGGPPVTLEVRGGVPSSTGAVGASFGKDEVVLPHGIVVYLSLPEFRRDQVAFDSIGEAQLAVQVPLGTPAIDIYLQAFGEDSMGNQYQLYSNGLKMTIVP